LNVARVNQKLLLFLIDCRHVAKAHEPYYTFLVDVVGSVDNCFSYYFCPSNSSPDPVIIASIIGRIPQEGLGRFFLFGSPLLLRDELAFFRQQRRFILVWEKSTMAGKVSAPEQPRTRESQISDDTILKMSKEIAVKFIEVGRLTPSTFNETFRDIHKTIEETVRGDD